MPYAIAALAVVAPLAAPADVSDRLEAIRARHGAPALAGVLIEDARVAARGVCGVRAAGFDAPAGLGDRWHIGSCTKAMTATLLATFVAEGRLTWETTVAEALPDLGERIHPDLRGVTLRELVRHRSGLSPGGPGGLFQELAAEERGGTLGRAEARRAFVERALAGGPGGERGAFVYSNAGYVIAGAIAEAAGGTSWEDLLRERIFAPLGMSSAGFGAPGDAEAVSEPRGHIPDGTPIPPGPLADNPPFLGPAGTVHASLEDWAKFVIAHLRGPDLPEGERDALGLSRADYRELHDPGAMDLDAHFGEDAGYAGGWLVVRRPWAADAPDGPGLALNHAGSNTMWFAVAWAGPEADRAVLVATNAATPAAQAAAEEAAGVLLTGAIPAPPPSR